MAEVSVSGGGRALLKRPVAEEEETVQVARGFVGMQFPCFPMLLFILQPHKCNFWVQTSRWGNTGPNLYTLHCQTKIPNTCFTLNALCK